MKFKDLCTPFHLIGKKSTYNIEVTKCSPAHSQSNTSIKFYGSQQLANCCSIYACRKLFWNLQIYLYLLPFLGNSSDFLSNTTSWNKKMYDLWISSVTSLSILYLCPLYLITGQIFLIKKRRWMFPFPELPYSAF